ncbi:hypothetical protein GCM10010488_29310 [Oerskovia jenensis]
MPALRRDFVDNTKESTGFCARFRAETVPLSAESCPIRAECDLVGAPGAPGGAPRAQDPHTRGAPDDAPTAPFAVSRHAAASPGTHGAAHPEGWAALLATS